MTLDYRLVPLKELGSNFDEDTPLTFVCGHCHHRVLVQNLERHAINVHGEDEISVDTSQRSYSDRDV